MSNEYQLRKDIDKLYSFLEGVDKDNIDSVVFRDELETILGDYCTFDDIKDISGGDLTDYVKKSDVDLKFELESPNPVVGSNGGYMVIGLNVGDGF